MGCGRRTAPNGSSPSFATARAGVIQVNINPAYRVHELEYALNKVSLQRLDHRVPGSRAAIISPCCGSWRRSWDEAAPGRLSSARLPHLRTVIRLGAETTPGCCNFDQVPALGGPAERRRLGELAAILQPDDAINIQFTSGTTGLPKGATLTHFNILNNGYFVGQAMNFTEQDRLCIPVPFYHCFGMVLANLNCIIHGAAMVIPNDGF